MSEQPQKAVIYARVSSKEQEKEGYSIPAQLKLLRDYALQKGFSVVQEYEDVETAKHAGRTNFTEMAKFLKAESKKGESANRCRAILVEKTDRLYRNLKDWVILDELGVEIHFVKENFVLSEDSRSSEKLMHGIKVLMAKNYIDNLSEETKKGMAEKAAQGVYPGGAPLGYLNTQAEGKRIIQLNPEVAPLIAKLFEWYVTGKHSLLEVAKMATAEGLTYGKAGSKIHRSLVHRILTNPIYYGGFRWKGKLYEGKHEPLISKGLFDAVQERLSDMGKPRAQQRKNRWAFQGLVSCGHCGCALTAEIQKGKYVYYHCTGNRGRCPEKYVREEEIARQFGQALKAIKMDDEVLAWVTLALRESHRDEKQHHDEMIAKLQRQYQKLQHRIDQIYVDKLDGEISAELFERKSAEWRNEQAEILRTIEKHQAANQSYLEEGIKLLELSQRAVSLYEMQPMKEKRRLLDFVCSNSVWKNGELIPSYRKPFDLLALTNATHQKEKANMGDHVDLSPIWLPR